MPYVALKPCSFAGNSYKVGETVPDEVIRPGAAKNLLTMKVIGPQADAESPNAAPAPATPTAIPLRFHGATTAEGQEGDLEVTVTPEGLQKVFDVLTTTAAAAEPIVNAMTERQALLLLVMTDKRKSIQAAIEDRVNALSGEAGEG